LGSCAHVVMDGAASGRAPAASDPWGREHSLYVESGAALDSSHVFAASDRRSLPAHAERVCHSVDVVEPRGDECYLENPAVVEAGQM